MKSVNNINLKDISKQWKGSALCEESSLHQISPYIGKMKSSMARTLLNTFSRESDVIYDPYSGSGAVALEAWFSGRNVIANDLSPYAFILTQAKLFPQNSIEESLIEINKVHLSTQKYISKVDLRHVPVWVRSFFHPETLREIITWFRLLKARKNYFLLSCLLGILHHQRPGFLSYPSSHTVPYLREKNFPRHQYPEMYEYRSVKERLEKKAMRALKRVPQLNNRIVRKCYMRKTENFTPNQKINAIITSPPYMRQLSYGRDNRLRLWFLGEQNWKQLDHKISPTEKNFLKLCKSCFKLWHSIITPKGLCVLVLGDVRSRTYNMSLPDVVAQIATREIGGYSVCCKFTETIPDNRRVRRNNRGSITETVLVLQKR